jgi:CubicO group peptidase (beta-lactamase class C family)
MHTYQHRNLIYGLIALIVTVCAIAVPVSAAPPIHAPEQDVIWPTDGWLESTPEAQGMDSGSLAGLFAAAAERDITLHSAVITRGGVLVAEGYTPPLDAESRQNLFSCAKSVTATVFGIARDDGIIESLDQPAAAYFPAWAEDERAAITLDDLLTMRSGLSWPDATLYTLAMSASPDWVQFVLDLPLETAPGTEFLYNSGNTHLLSAIVQIETGEPMRQFAQARLFDPLGIAEDAYTWQSDPQGVTSGAWGLLMTARDAARIGYLMLRDGVWDGEQIVSSEWIARATTPVVAFDEDRSYGYQWWIFHDGAFYAAAGFNGQFIFVMPSLDLVVIMTANEPGERDQLPRLLFEEFVIPAVVADEALPANPDGVAALEAAIAAFEE